MVKRWRNLIAAALDTIVDRYVPDVPPIVFDPAGSARWRDMVEAAARITPEAA